MRAHMSLLHPVGPRLHARTLAPHARTHTGGITPLNLGKMLRPHSDAMTAAPKNTNCIDTVPEEVEWVQSGSRPAIISTHAAPESDSEEEAPGRSRLPSMAQMMLPLRPMFSNTELAVGAPVTMAAAAKATAAKATAAAKVKIAAAVSATKANAASPSPHASVAAVLTTRVDATAKASLQTATSSWATIAAIADSAGSTAPLEEEHTILQDREGASHRPAVQASTPLPPAFIPELAAPCVVLREKVTMLTLPRCPSRPLSWPAVPPATSPAGTGTLSMGLARRRRRSGGKVPVALRLGTTTMFISINDFGLPPSPTCSLRFSLTSANRWF